MQASFPPGQAPAGVQANLARILATTARQWGVARVAANPSRGREEQRSALPYLRAATQTALGLTWGWCY